MLGTTLVYAGLAAGAAAGLSRLLREGLPRLRSRRQAALLAGGGAALLAAGALLPAPTRRVANPRSRLDELVPCWQFAEHHRVRIRADPPRVERAIRQVTPREIRLFRLLTGLRNPRRAWRRQAESLLAAPADRPILEVALGSGFLLLAEVPGREMVFGSLVLAPPELERRGGLSPARFVALDQPGCAKAVMGFLIEDEGDGRCRLETETRVVATDAAARRRFAVYWRLIYPGSSLIRYGWLDAIRRRAEGV